MDIGLPLWPSVMKFKHSSLQVLLFLAFLGEFINAQRFDNLMLGVDYPGISDTCADALNITISNCPSFLGSVSVDNPRLSSNQLSQLCTSDCHTSLTSVRQTIANGCNQDSDIISYDDIDWPATLVIDHFLYTYDLSCRKDSASGQFCDEIFLSWLNQSTLTAVQNCSDCMLGVVQTQLNSPFGYDEDFAQDFESVTASCGASGYAFTSPTPYTLNSSATAPSSPTSTPTCSDPYQVQSGDSCDSIATSQRVSTYAVISAGGLNPTCTNLLAGSSLCLPGSCDLYRVQYGDTCESIIAANSGLTGTNLTAWNPNINVLCGNIDSLVETLICVSPPGGSLGQVTISTPLAVSTATSPVSKPTNAPEGSNSRCAQWYVIQEGDYCDSVSIHQNIALKDFYFLNPEINANCTNLLLGLAYCVQAVGDISTYSGYPSSSKIYTLTSLTYTTTTSTLPPAAPASTTAFTALPTAPGTVSDCKAYAEYVPVPGLTDQSQSPDVSVITDDINSCDYVISGYGIALSDFLSWNPSLSSVSPCALQANYSYCTSNSSWAEPQDPAGDLCIPVDDIYPGTITTCSCFTVIQGSTSGIRLCSDIASDANITVDQLTTWNPWVGSDCDTGVYTNLSADDTRAVCIGVNSTAPTATASSVSSASITPPETETTSMGPTQTGIIVGCTQYYTVQDGDSCAAIDAQFGITFDQFYAWNPAVGSNCETLWIGYAYCVAGPTSTTSSTFAVTTPPAPTRGGTPSTCTKYYTVQSGDGCWSIGQMFGIDFDTLYRWNPSIGSNCESLWPDYSLCVAGGP